MSSEKEEFEIKPQELKKEFGFFYVEVKINDFCQTSGRNKKTKKRNKIKHQ